MDMMTAAQSSAVSLANQGAIHLGPILAPGTNETISIVIPLSAQLASLTKNLPPMDPHHHQLVSSVKQENSVVVNNTDNKTLPKRPPKMNPVRIKEDKTKGCPYPNCSRYGRAFSRAHDLKRHIARHEARENKTTEPHQQLVYSCTECGEQFYNEQILLRHRQIHHNNGATSVITSHSGPPYTCHFCKKDFDREDLLHAHIPTHIKTESTPLSLPTITRYQPSNGPPPLIQTIPSAGTSSSSSSMATVTGTSDDDFRLEDMLLLRNKTPNRPLASTSSSTTIMTSPTSGKIRCEYCSKTFKTKWTLSSHVAAHEGRFQYQCCICSKRFVRKSHYESHVRSHDAARPYVCEHCGKTFKESKHRREHLKRKHPSNKNAIQSLLDSISACVNEEAAAAAAEQAKLTILMPMNFST